MILHGQKKRILKDVIRYFVETTGEKYDGFILSIDRAEGKQESELTYPEWLALKSLDLLAKHEITLADCIENKDVINAAINEDSSRNEGEFFTPLVWAKDGREYLKQMLGDQWGKVHVWDASCYTMDTELLTARGWVTYDDLKDEDLVYALNPDTLKGEFVRFYNRFKKEVSEELVHFKGSSFDLLVTQDHKMFTRLEKHRGVEHNFSFQTAREMYDTLKETPSGERRLGVPVSAVLQDITENTEADKNKSLFWQLVGFYIGDGFLVSNRANTDYTEVRFVLKKERKIEYLKNLLNTLGYDYNTNDYSEKDSGVYFNIYDKGFIDFIVKNDLTDTLNKHIPFNNLPVSNYIDMYRGLVNSDGSVDDYGSIDFTTVSEKLQKDVELLLTMLGYRVTVSDKAGVKNTLYRVRGSHRQEINLSYSDVELVPYTGSVWDITLDKHHVFMVRRNGKSSFSGNCGTGNLMREEGYPADKLFMSSLLPEDIEIVKATSEFKGVEAFQLDFLNGLDLDEYNMRFSENLPPRLRQILENDEPIVFYMNPPYKVMEARSSDVGAYMSSLGMAKCALDIFHQFMYRIVMLKRTYRLTNMYMGIFGPITMFHSKMIEPMYNEFKEEFKFVNGMCFDAGDFSNTSESVGWIVGYTVWRSKKEGEEDKSIVLEAKTIGENDTPVTIGSRLITAIDENLHTWVEPKDVIRYDEQLPLITTFNNFVGVTTKAPSNAFAYMMSSNYVIRATRRACITTIPTPDNIPITEENFWRCVASYAARRCYASKQNPYNNCQYYSKPDTSIEGYNEWLTDALIVFLFDYNSQSTAYRDIEQDGNLLNFSNALFPIDSAIIKQVCTDEKILADLERNAPTNQFIVNVLSQLQPNFSQEAMDLYQYSLQIILESLSGTRRADFDYGNWTQAWDAGLLQIREVKGLVPTEQHEKYSYLLSKLKHKLYDGIYKYGFMMDAAFEVESEDDYDEDELSENYEQGGIL